MHWSSMWVYEYGIAYSGHELVGASLYKEFHKNNAPTNDLIEKVAIYMIANVDYACKTLGNYSRPLKH